MDLFNLFKTLNSAQRSWQVALAITFGMVSAFLPLFTIINLILIIIVFTLNIPIWLFIVSSALFSLLASFLDPTFASIGYDILTNYSLNSIFTNMFNNPIYLWSSYNNTLVMGSFIVSLIAFIPSFLIFKILINTFRNTLEKYFKDAKYLGFLNPFSQKKLDKKPGIFRLSGLVFILSFIAIISAIVILLLDFIIELALEFTLSKYTKTNVYISNVHTSFKDTTLDINNILIKSNTSKDNTKIKNIHLKLDTQKLIHKNIQVALVDIKNVVLNTTAEKIPENSKNNKESTSSNNSSKNDNMKLPSVDDILEKENLQSLKEAKKIKKDLNNIYAKYKNYDKSKFNKAKIEELKNRAIVLKEKIQNIDNPSQIEEILKESKSIKNELSKIKNELKDIKRNYDKDKVLVKKHIKTIKTLPKEEYNHLKNKYTLNQDGALNFMETYILPDSKKYLQQAIGYYNMAKPYISNKEDSIAVKRLKGHYIRFGNGLKFPSVVIQKIKGDALMNSFGADFKIENISSDPKLYNKIIIATINGTNKFYKSANITISHDALKKVQKTIILSNIKKFKTKEYSANKKLILNNILLDSNAKIIVTDFLKIEAKNNTNILKTNMLFKANNTKAQKILKNILENIHSFDINYKIIGSLEHQKISINSNIDKKIASGLKSTATKELIKYRTKLKSKINTKFKEEIGTDFTNKDFKEFEEILIDIKNNDFSFTTLSKSTLIASIKQKEQDKLKAKAKEEALKKKNQIKNKVKNKLKSFF